MYSVSAVGETLAADRISLLHVDDNVDFLEVTAAFLDREDDRFDVTTATSVAEGLDVLRERAIDCIVSDYDMPERSGLAFLEAVRADYPELPFILFTGKGSEEVASDAISSGVTDYLQKGSGSERYELLAKRVTNAVSRYRARTNYREILENVPDGVVVHDPSDGEFIDMNEQYAELFGYTRAELLDLGFETIHPDEPPYTLEGGRQRIKRAVEEGSMTFEWPGVHRTGERIWHEVHLRPTRLNGRQRLLAVVRDISDRKEREETLQYERDRLAAVFAAVPEPVVHVAFDDETPVVQRVNDAFVDVFGYDQSAAVGHSLNDLIVPDRLLDTARTLDELSAEADTLTERVRRETADGEREFLFKAAPVVQENGRVEWVASYVDSGE